MKNQEPDEQQTGICNSCGDELAPIMEDMHPDGIGYYEVVGYKPCPCREGDPYDQWVDSQLEIGGEDNE